VFDMARAYWQFAWKNPELYQVMHGLGGVPFCTDDTRKAAGRPSAEAEAVFEAVAQIFRALPPLAAASEAELKDAVHIIWATLHGLVALTMAGRITGGQAGALHLVGHAVRDFLAARGVAVSR
jgi:hypothetical protein